MIWLRWRAGSAAWMCYATLISPMRYYIDQVLFKGNGLANVWHDILGIVVQWSDAVPA